MTGTRRRADLDGRSSLSGRTLDLDLRVGAGDRYGASAPEAGITTLGTRGPIPQSTS